MTDSLSLEDGQYRIICDVLSSFPYINNILIRLSNNNNHIIENYNVAWRLAGFLLVACSPILLVILVPAIPLAVFEGRMSSRAPLPPGMRALFDRRTDKPFGRFAGWLLGMVAAVCLVACVFLVVTMATELIEDPMKGDRNDPSRNLTIAEILFVVSIALVFISLRLLRNRGNLPSSVSINWVLGLAVTIAFIASELPKVPFAESKSRLEPIYIQWAVGVALVVWLTWSNGDPYKLYVPRPRGILSGRPTELGRFARAGSALGRTGQPGFAGRRDGPLAPRGGATGLGQSSGGSAQTERGQAEARGRDDQRGGVEVGRLDGHGPRASQG